MFPLKKKAGPTKVEKLCVYCGHIVKEAMSAMVNCPMCKKRGLRTVYGEVDGKPHTVED